MANVLSMLLIKHSYRVVFNSIPALFLIKLSALPMKHADSLVFRTKQHLINSKQRNKLIITPMKSKIKKW